MISMTSIAPETLGLLFLLGMRHGLDPDHIAVIDNITFRALDERPKAAAWTGFLFSTGHTISVLMIAALFGFLGQMITLPPEFETAMAIFIIGLFIVIGTLNLRALLAKEIYVPKGWRHSVLPGLLRVSTHPLVTMSIGLVFGLVIDTAAQIAAWGVAASQVSGIAGAVVIGLSFAAGMILTDGLDSLVITRLVTDKANLAQARTYRRGVGWLIVGLSYVMAAYALLQLLQWNAALSDRTFLAVGVLMAVTVISVAAVSLIKRKKVKDGPSI
ncbi:hypothetical protein MMA231_03611 (plasmid) [Asticcacaulis sp. MM231]|uniref:HoxN/HupN/NixA family nickel/cobalt transporter n=1 Tax=Asticcacaulis sp. MM231 TaxID=3157666 RepID=UPI0032D59BB4